MSGCLLQPDGAAETMTDAVGLWPRGSARVVCRSWLGYLPTLPGLKVLCGSLLNAGTVLEKDPPKGEGQYCYEHQITE